MNNKRAGMAFERRFCEMLARDGFWAHFTGGNKNGQPADIIAARNREAYLIDAKDCENDRFVFSRIEDNQEMAMKRWAACGNGDGLFALNTSEDVFLLTYSDVKKLEAVGAKSIGLNKIKEICIPYAEWKEEIGWM